MAKTTWDNLVFESPYLGLAEKVIRRQEECK
jgi:hypothetical protein